MLEKLKQIYLDKNFDNTTTEQKVLNKLDKIIEEWPIDEISSKEDLINFLFKTYFYTSKYKPYIPYWEIIYRYFLIFLILVLIWIAYWWNILYNFENGFNYKWLWIMFSNIVYLAMVFYIFIRIYTYIRKLIRKEVKKNNKKEMLFWFLKFNIFILIIPFTWFIWSMLAALSNILYLTAIGVIKDINI